MAWLTRRSRRFESAAKSDRIACRGQTQTRPRKIGHFVRLLAGRDFSSARTYRTAFARRQSVHLACVPCCVLRKREGEPSRSVAYSDSRRMPRLAAELFAVGTVAEVVVVSVGTTKPPMYDHVCVT